MKILIALSRFPWPIDKGDRLRAFKQIEGLAKNNEIHLVCLNDEIPAKEGLDALNSFCKSLEIVQQKKIGIAWNLFKGLFNKIPFQVNYFRSKKIRNLIASKIASLSPDAIYVQLIRMNENIPDSNVPMLLDYQDAFSAGMQNRIEQSSFWERPWVRKEARRLREYENSILPRYRHCTIISSQDWGHLSEAARKKTTVVPNGVHESFLNYPTDATEKKFDLLFTGNLGYHPNVIAGIFLIKNILPLLRQKGMKLKVCLAGARPDPALKALVDEDVQIIGPVKDLRPYFAQSRLFVAPMLSGAGLQNKLLESMAMGLPTLTTSISNAALGAKPGTEIVVCQNEMEFAEGIIELLNQPEKANEIAARGQSFIRKNYDWKQINERLENLLIKISGKES